MAANPPIGNNFLEGSIGVGRVEFDSVDLGKTIGDIEFEKVEDIKDITFAQDGTQPHDKVPTGIFYMAKVVLGETTIALIDKIDDHSNKTPGGTGLKLGKSIYRSLRDNAKQTVFKRVDSQGNSSTNPLYWLTAPKTFITTTGIPVLGPDSQRSIEATIYLFYDETNELFAYTGLASCAGVV
jgi:hypothetical protein